MSSLRRINANMGVGGARVRLEVGVVWVGLGVGSTFVKRSPFVKRSTFEKRKPFVKRSLFVKRRPSVKRRPFVKISRVDKPRCEENPH